jgi:hypothetical protein
MMRLLCIGVVVAAFTSVMSWSDSVGPALEKTASTPVTVYDPDPGHLWNRLHRALWVRVADDGKEYGHDRLDPLLWPESKHLTTGKANEEAVAALDEFLRKDGDKLVADPLKQSVLQRDLWAILDWAAEPGGKLSGGVASPGAGGAARAAGAAGSGDSTAGAERGADQKVTRQLRGCRGVEGVCRAIRSRSSGKGVPAGGSV